jgi:hypothetical protein
MNPKEIYLSKPWLKYYPKGVPSEVEVPEISVPELFDRMADKYADKTALIFYGNKIITTGEGGMITTDNKKLYEKANVFA